MSDCSTIIAIAQSAYFLMTGVWPVVHIRSFLRVTGPKHDLWLVKTVGVIVAVIGGAIGLGGWRKALSPAIILLAIGSAGGLMFVDVIYVAKRVISRIYLLDAAIEVVLIVGWVVCISRGTA
jgi:hypothetical protein